MEHPFFCWIGATYTVEQVTWFGSTSFSWLVVSQSDYLQSATAPVVRDRKLYIYKSVFDAEHGPNPKCRLYWCLIDFIDRYSQ